MFPQSMSATLQIRRPEKKSIFPECSPESATTDAIYTRTHLKFRDTAHMIQFIIPTFWNLMLTKLVYVSSEKKPLKTTLTRTQKKTAFRKQLDNTVTHIRKTAEWFLFPMQIRHRSKSAATQRRHLLRSKSSRTKEKKFSTKLLKVKNF